MARSQPSTALLTAMMCALLAGCGSGGGGGGLGPAIQEASDGSTMIDAPAATPNAAPAAAPAAPSTPAAQPSQTPVVTATPSTAWAAAASARLKALQAATGGFSQVQLDPRWGSIKLIGNGNWFSSAATPADKARAFLAAYGAIFTVAPDLSNVQLIDQVHSGTGHHLRFGQVYQGLPVEGAQVVVHLTNSGAVFRATSTMVPALNPRMTPVISTTAAMSSVNDRLHRSAARRDAPRIVAAIFATPTIQTRAWVINFTPGDRPGFWSFVVDATSGAILKAENRVHSAAPVGLNGTGTIYSYNPIKTLDDNPAQPFSSSTATRRYVNFPDSGDQDYFAGTDTRVYRLGGIIGVNPDVMGGTFATPTLNGLFGQTVRITPSQISTFVNGSMVNFHRNDARFEEVNVFFWIDTFNRFLQDPVKVGVSPLVVRTRANRLVTTNFIEANVHDVATSLNDPMGVCTGVGPTVCAQNIAFYDYNNPSLHFYNGGATLADGTPIASQPGVDLAEDTDVVLHEYTHALQDGMIPGGCCSAGASVDSAAMAEGYGDYSAAMFAEALGRAGRDPATFGAWANSPPGNTTGPMPTREYGSPSGGPKRRLDGTRHLGFDFTDNDPFNRGQIWSAALWDIKRRVGFRIANRAIYESFFLRGGEGDDMGTAANAVLLAHDIMDFGISRNIINNVFVQRGILPPSGGAAPNLTAAKTVNPKTIQLTFDQPLDQATVNMDRTWNSTGNASACFNQVGNFFAITGNVTKTIKTVGQTSPQVVTITLNTTMTTDERPRVRVLELTDTFGNRAFCIDTDAIGGTTDGTPPALVSITKQSTTVLRTVWSEPMNAGSITSGTFQLSGRHLVQTVTQVSPTTYDLTISPALVGLERVIVRLTGAVSDANGVVLNAASISPVVTP